MDWFFRIVLDLLYIATGSFRSSLREEDDRSEEEKASNLDRSALSGVDPLLDRDSYTE